MKKRGVRLILIAGIIVIAAAAVYFTFFYSRTCEDRGCFNSALSECKKFNFVEETEDSFWYYKIKGESNNLCVVDVELLQLKAGSVDLVGLEGKEMACSLPLGSTKSPRENLERCHGLLKEELQKIIINKLHNYITENLGEIGEELETPQF